MRKVNMLSRVAETIYWMSRQVERAENLARFLEITHTLSLDQPEHFVDPWEPLIKVTADDEIFASRWEQANAESVTQFLAFDDQYANSMLSSLRQARENARVVRESLSSECYEQINEFYHFVHEASLSPQLDAPNRFFDAVRRLALQWTGVLDSTMSRDLSWHFANVGRLIERADKTSRILDAKYFNLLPSVEDVGTAVDDVQWSALLLAISGFETYRRQHHLIAVEKVIDFFIFNDSFPRSILFCVVGFEHSLEKIVSTSGDDRRQSARERTIELRTKLANTDVSDVLSRGMHQFIDKLQIDLNWIGDGMNDDYFNGSV